MAFTVNGSSVLCGDGLRPPCVRIARWLRTLLEVGFRPRTNTTANIDWVPRELNGVADHASNCALDMRSSWELQSVEMSQWLGDQHVKNRFCVDGARRGERHASGGMLVMAYTSYGNPTYLYRAGGVVGCLDSAFSAEVLDMVWGLQEFSNIFWALRVENKQVFHR